jgi:hypothetical protein
MTALIIIGCGSEKRKDVERTPATYLYTGSLFRARAKYAARRAPDMWWICSAKYGIIAPGTWVQPYDKRITDMHEVDRACWAIGSVQEWLSSLFADEHDAARTKLGALRVELHLGAEYAEIIKAVLQAVGISNVHWPLQGLGIGEQLAWYKQDAMRSASLDPMWPARGAT